MLEPHLLLKQMNKLCIKMTHVRRKPNSKKHRKIIFRTMKKLSHCIAKHGARYRHLLNDRWEETDWTYIQAQQVMNRINHILNQLPTAINKLCYTIRPLLRACECLTASPLPFINVVSTSREF